MARPDAAVLDILRAIESRFQESDTDTRAASAAIEHIHVPTPGDHYSAATGSAIMTLIYEMSRVHECKGGDTKVMVTRGTRHDYPVGECVEVEPSRPSVKWKKAADMAVGWLGLGRPFGESAYLAHSAAISRDFDGAIFVHNNPVAIPSFRKRHPAAKICLWANNELFHAYCRRETARIADAADRMICCSQYIAEEMKSHLSSAARSKVRVVLNGVDSERFRPAASPVTGDPIVLFVGRVTPVKGPDLLLKAARRVLSRLAPADRVKFRIVGSSNFSALDPLTSYERELRALSEPIPKAVEFVPFLDRQQVLREYQAASIFCIPSNWDDPCPLTVPEGMACGLPTVASRRGGIPEVGGDAVLYFDPPDIDGLATHLERLISAPAERRKWGDKARQRAIEVNWSRQYEALKEALVE